jgi:capsular exopolysaccharide synthesis family protein
MQSPDPKKLLPHKAADTNHDHVALPAASHDPAAVPAGPPPALSAMPGLGTMLHALRRCWKWAVPLALLVAGLAVAASWVLVPGQFTSSVVFRLQPRPNQGSLENEENFVNVQRAQVATLKSYTVLDEALRRSKVEEKYGGSWSPTTLGKKLVTQFNEGPELMQVVLADDNAEAAAAVLAALSEVYPEQVQKADQQRVESRIAQLSRRLVIRKRRDDVPTLAEQLSDKRGELQAAEKRAGLDDANTLASKYNNALNQQSNAQKNLNDQKLRRQAVETELSLRQKRLSEAPAVIVSNAEAEETIQNKAEYTALMKKITDVREKMTWNRKNLEGELLRKHQDEARRALRGLQQEQKELITEAKTRLVEKAQALAQAEERKAIVKLKDDLEQARKLELSLDVEARRASLEVENYRAGGPKAPPEVEALRDQVKQLEKEFGKVGDDKAALEGALPITPRATVHAKPFVPTVRDYGKAIKIAVAAGALAFLGVLGGLCLLGASSRRVCSADDVSQGLGLRVVGTLPRLPASARNKSAVAQALGGLDTRYGLTESIDALRTVLLHSPRLDGARVVVVTSALGGEGKTTLASHLAASLARAWRKTLLIDGDLRKPAAHEQFDLPLEPGLSEALRGDIEFDDTVKPTMTGRLWLMPAGKVDAHSLQALAQEGMAGVFERLKEQYDFIIIDTSPVLPIPDALLLAQQADTVLLSVMRDHSRLPAVYAAQQKLEALGIRVLGTVVIGEKTETYGHAVPYPS